MTRTQDLLEETQQIIRRKHLSFKTEKSYLRWIQRFFMFHSAAQPMVWERSHVENFLTHLAVHEQISASTQNQAFSALLFFFREVLGQDLDNVDALAPSLNKSYSLKTICGIIETSLRHFIQGIKMAIQQSKIDEISERYKLLQPFMDEQQSRLWAGAEAHAIGHGGLRAVAKATGFSLTKISRGRDEVAGNVEVAPAEMIRHPGAGRPRTEDTQPDLVDAVLALVEPTTRGDPESPLRWTSKSVRSLAKELCSQGFSVGRNKVHQLLIEQGFSLQAPRKTDEGADHPDRDQQFQYINQTVMDFHENGQPVVSVDTKKKELVGEFYNKGQEWQPKGQPEGVNAYDFPHLAIGKAIPYGIYDIFAKEGWVNVGISVSFRQKCMIWGEGRCKLMNHTNQGGMNHEKERVRRNAPRSERSRGANRRVATKQTEVEKDAGRAVASSE